MSGWPRPGRLALLLVLLGLLGLGGCSGPARFAANPAPAKPSPAPAPALARCRPSAAHPEPVVLVHGTLAVAAVNWRYLAPLLQRAGYCVYALDYGLGGILPIEDSARQLAGYAQAVLAATGAHKLDLVGHSQGGLMPRYWLRFLGGAGYVDDFVALAPPNHGTDNPRAHSSGGVCPACAQMATGSAFLARLNADGDTIPGVDYTVIETRYDDVVTPYPSAFLSGPRVSNILVQDACPADHVDHVGLAFDPVVAQWVLDALAHPGPADPRLPVQC